MSAPRIPVTGGTAPGSVAMREGLLDTELAFYGSYRWSLDLYPTVREAIERLRDEAERFSRVPDGWQTAEVATNVVLLACGVLNSTDAYLRGPALRLPSPVAARSVGRAAGWLLDTTLDVFSSGRRASVRQWRERWLAAADAFLSVFVTGPADAAAFADPARRLAEVLVTTLPPGLAGRRLLVPSAFTRLDLTHRDVLALAKRTAESLPDPSQPLVVVGLRTSGSYFAPLLRASLRAHGFRDVALLTIEPNKGAGRRERAALARFAGAGYAALLADDPPDTAGTVVAAVAIARRAGFPSGKVKVVTPTHPASRGWSRALPRDVVVTLEPEHWQKHTALTREMVESRLAEYFHHRGAARTRVVGDSLRADEYNRLLETTGSDERRVHLKRVFEVELEGERGEKEVRYVLAKSVGCGWFAYHAFLAGHELGGLVPPLLGLRDGILYTEWLPHTPARETARDEWIRASADYVAARVQRLRVGSGTMAGMDLGRHNNGIRVLEEALSRAYGRLLAGTLMRSRLRRRLWQEPCPHPTLIDGDMRRREWVVVCDRLLKIDYEEHGLGKAALNVTDPAYDLADASLELALSPGEESRLIERYVAGSPDRGVEARLFISKLLAGLWAMKEAEEQLLGRPHLAAEQQEQHRRFVNAWHFLIANTARHCGRLCRPAETPRWRSPLVVLDVDGVLDRRLLGFPHTTAAGIEALALLHRHGLSIVLNTARSAGEVREYCEAYGAAGGVAEYGSYAWDAVRQEGRALVDPEAAPQLETLRRWLGEIPGVFLDDHHTFSVRAFTYRDRPGGFLASLASSRHAASVGDGALSPLPAVLVNRAMRELGLDRVSVHHTTIDTTFVAKGVDKGVGLLALRDQVLGPDTETIAVGDSEADLPMFRVATRSFAPRNLTCPAPARSLGCRVVRHAHQRGLLEIARAITGTDGGRRPRETPGDLFEEVLRAADRGWARNLASAVFALDALGIFFW